jgi:heptaprenyl diphosphate synthase
VLYAIADDLTSPRLRAILSQRAIADDDVSEALDLLRESPALKRARETVRIYARRARAQLSVLPRTPTRAALDSLASFLADRTA